MTTPSQIVTAYLRAFTGNDPDAIASLVAEGFRNEHHSALGSSCVGRDQYRRRLPHFLESFTDRRYTIDDMVEAPREGETVVVVRYRFIADHVESGEPVEIPGTMWFGVGGGEIHSRVDTWDSLTFQNQIST